MARHLDGELHASEREILSRSRTRPWKLKLARSADGYAWPDERTQLIVFGEPRSRLFAVHRDSLPPSVLPSALSGKQLRWRWLGAKGVSRYTLSQFLVDIAPRWADPAPRAAITVTDHGAADWILVDSEHVAAGWEQHHPTLDQLGLSISTLLEITKPLPSTLPFR